MSQRNIRREWFIKQNGICGIYRIRNVHSNRAYVGSSVDIGARWQAHIASLNSGRNNKALQTDWNSNSPTNYAFEILEVMDKTSTDEVLLSKEQEWWDLEKDPFNDRPKHRAQTQHTKNAKQKMSESAKKRWNDPSQKASLSETISKTLIGNTRSLGYKHSVVFVLYA